MLKIFTNSLKFAFAVAVITIAIAAIWIFKSSPIFLGSLIVAGSTIVMWQGFVIVSTIATFISTMGTALYGTWVEKKPRVIETTECHTQ